MFQQQQLFFFGVFLALIFMITPSCSKKRQPSMQRIREKNIPLFIQMPKNNFVFENIAPLIYQSTIQHFKRVGYKLVNHENDGYCLRMSIKNLFPTNKYVSPDVLLFHTNIKLELLCELYNFDKKLIQQKTFFFSTLLSKPRNPIINDSFLAFEYKKLMNRSIPQIEQYFRPALNTVEGLKNC